LLQQILFAQFGIAKDLQEQTGTECLTGMHGDHGATTVGMAQKMMTAFDPNYIKTVIGEDGDNLPAF
jgi:hypothetical protein